MDISYGNPLFTWETFYEDTGGEYPEKVNQKVFVSNSYDVHTKIDGDCFDLRMKNGTMLYIMDIRETFEAFEPEKNTRHTREIWMCAGDGTKQYLCNNKEGNMLSSMVDALYDKVAENASHPKIKREIKSAIDAYFNDDLEDDNFDELPFN